MKTITLILNTVDTARSAYKNWKKIDVQKPFFCIGTLLWGATLLAQAPEVDWQKTYGGSGFDGATSIGQTADNGYIVAGTSNSNDGDVTGNHGNDDYWITKINPTGNVEWQKSLGGNQNDRPNGIQQTQDGGYIVAGSSTSNNGDVSGNHGNSDFWVVKLNSVGNITWQKSLGGSDLDIGRSIQQTSDGGYIVAGNSRSTDGDVTGNHGGYDYWVVKLNAFGNIEWQKSYGGTTDDSAYSIQQTDDDGFIIVGHSNSNDGDVSGNNGDWDYWVVKLNENGNIIWEKSFGGTFIDVPHKIQQTIDGGYIVAGFTASDDGDVTGYQGNIDYWIIKLSPTGDLEWQKALGGTENDTAYSVKQTIGGGYIVVGYTESTDGDITGHQGGRDCWTVKLNALGEIEWQKSLGGSEDEVFNDLHQSTDGSYIAVGFSESNDGDVTGNHGNGDYWIVKLDPDPLGIEDTKSQISVFPNPVKSILNISANEPLKSVLVYNQLGQQLITSEHFANSIQLDLSGLSPKLYFITISTEKNKETFKIIVE